MPSIKFDTIIETAKVVSGFRDIQNAVHQTAEKAEKDGKSIDDVISNIQNSFNIAIGGWSIGKFVNQMMQVRGQFQQTEMAFKTMLQSEEKADALMKEMIHTAAITPFGVEDVTEGAKQLLAFNVAAEDVNKTLIGLGDVAAGMGLNLSDMVMLYGTTIAKGKMDTMDLYQFLNRGIPIADELAKVMGLDLNNAIGEVSKQIKAGKVTSDVFIQAMQSMTSEGSKFGGLMEEQSKTITGQISNIEDAIEQMFNELGKSQEGIINTGLDIASTLVENWEAVGKAVMVAATAYGSYKAVLMTVNALQVLNTKVLRLAVVEKRASAAAGIAMSNADAIAAAKTKLLTVAQQGLTVALKETAKATLLNPYVLLAAAITSVVVAIYSYVTRISSAEAAENALAKSLDNTNSKLDERNQKLQDLIRIIQNTDSTDLQKQLAFDELSKIAPSITEVYDSVEKLSKADLSQVNQQLNELSDESREQALKNQVEELKKLYKAIKDYAGSPYDAIKAGRSQDAISTLREKFGLDLSWTSDIKEWQDAISNLMSGLQTQLFEIEKAKEEIATPTKIDVELAKDKYEQSKEELDYLSKFALAMKNDIERNPTEIPFDGGEADRVIAELEKKANDLKQEQLKNPIQFTADKQKALDKYQELLTDIKRWRNTAWKQGTFIIPVEIQFRMKQLEDETNKAKGRFNYLIGKYEEANKDESYATAKKQAKLAYQAAVKAEKEAREGSNKEWEKSKEDLDNKKKEYEKYWGSISGATSKANKAVSDAKKKAEDQRKAQEELNEDLKQLQQKNIDTEISLMQEGTEKKLAEIKNDYKKRSAEIDKQEAEFKKKNKEAGKSSSLTKEQSDALAGARKLAEQEYNKQITDANKEAAKEELQALYDYLKEFGTIQQQKYAIAKEYDDKILKAQGENQKKLLEAQKKQALDSMDAKNFAMDIDWSASFKNVGNVLRDIAKETLDKVDAYMKTADFKALSATDKKTYTDLRKQLKSEQGNASSPFKMSTWNDIARYTEAYQTSVKSLISANEQHEKAVIELEQAEMELKNATSAMAYETAKTKVSRAQENVSSTAIILDNAQNNKDNAQNNLTDSTDQAAQGLDNFSKVLSNITSGSLTGFVKGIVGIIQSLSGSSKSLGSAFGELGSKIGGLIGAILSIIDALGEDPSSFIDQLLQKVIGVIDGLLEQLASGKLIETLLKDIGQLILTLLKNSLYDTTANALKTSTFGAIDITGWFDGNEEEIAKRREELIKEAEKLTKSIEGLKNELQKQSGAKAISTAEALVDAQKQQIENARQQLINENNYWSAHHSNDSYWHENAFEVYDHGSWAEVTKALQEYKQKNANADTVTDKASSYEDLLKLTPEQLDYIRSHYSQQWQAIKDVGKYDASDEKWEALADLAGTLADTVDSLNESLTQVSFDSLKDEFISTLMDMDSSAADFSDKFSEYLMQAVLSAQISNLMEDQMQAFYKDWAARAKVNNGTLTTTDVNALKKQWDELVEQGLAIRDQASLITGYTGSTSQSATSGGWSSMGQDTADELNGRFTALQIAGETIAQNMADTVLQMQSIVTLGISTNGAVLEIRNMMIMTNSYLEDIVKYAKLTYMEFGNKIDDMNKRLKEI